MKKLTFILFVALPVLSNAQFSNGIDFGKKLDHLNSKTEQLNNNGNLNINDTYLFTEFTQAKVLFKDKNISKFNLNINLMFNEIHFKNKEGQVLSLDDFDSIEEITTEEKTIASKLYNNRSELFEVLVKDEINLLKKTEVYIEPAKKGNGYDPDVPEHFKNTTNFYIESNGKISIIKTKKALKLYLVNELSLTKKEVKAFKLSPFNEETLITIIRKINNVLQS